MIAFDHELDASGLHCPLPLLRLKKALTVMNSGEVIRVSATDPAAHLDFGVFIEQTGHTMLQHDQQERVQFFWIKKG